MSGSEQSPSGSAAPGLPTNLAATMSADETSATVTWTAGTPAATSYQVSWALSATPPAPSSNSYGSPNQVSVTTTSTTLTGLTANTYYDVQIVALNGTAAAAPVFTTTNYASSSSQDGFFSVSVPNPSGETDYLRVGAADLTTDSENSLISAWPGLVTANDVPTSVFPVPNPTESPITMDLGTGATTGATLFSTNDVAIVAGNTIRLRAGDGYYSDLGNFESSTQGGISQTVNANKSIVSYEIETAGADKVWWKLAYDGVSSLGFAGPVSADFQLGDSYEMFFGLKTSNVLSAEFELNIGVIKLELNLSAIDIEIGPRSVSTALLGDKFEFSQENEIVAKTIKLALPTVAYAAIEAQIEIIGTILLVLGGLMTAVIGIVGTVDFSIASSNIANVLSNDALDLFYGIQAANSVIMLAGLILGIWQLYQRHIAEDMDSTYIKLSAAATPAIDITNIDQQILLDGVNVKLGTQSGADIKVTPASVTLTVPVTQGTPPAVGVPAVPAVSDPADSAVTLGPATIDISGTAVTVTGLTALTLVCGGSSIVLTDALISISGPAVSMGALAVEITDAVDEAVAAETDARNLALTLLREAVTAEIEAAIAARLAADVVEAVADDAEDAEDEAMIPSGFFDQ